MVNRTTGRESGDEETVMLTPEMEREILMIRCRIRREDEDTFIVCRNCGCYRAAAPVKQKLCVYCYAKALERAVHVAEASMDQPRRPSTGDPLFNMFTLGLGAVLGFLTAWVIAAWR
jgi:hypothetical protein